MRYFIVLLLLLGFSLGLTGEGKAQDSGAGLGVIVGEPTGITAKFWMSGRSAVDMALGWTNLGESNSSFSFHADYLFHNFKLFPVRPGRLPVYFGFGGRIKSEKVDGSDNTSFGVRLPLGIAYHFSEAPVELFAEFVPFLKLSPSTTFTTFGAIGVRYYFE